MNGFNSIFFKLFYKNSFWRILVQKRVFSKTYFLEKSIAKIFPKKVFCRGFFSKKALLADFVEKSRKIELIILILYLVVDLRADTTRQCGNR